MTSSLMVSAGANLTLASDPGNTLIARSDKCSLCEPEGQNNLRSGRAPFSKSEAFGADDDGYTGNRFMCVCGGGEGCVYLSAVLVLSAGSSNTVPVFLLDLLELWPQITALVFPWLSQTRAVTVRPGNGSDLPIQLGNIWQIASFGSGPSSWAVT